MKRFKAAVKLMTMVSFDKHNFVAIATENARRSSSNWDVEFYPATEDYATCNTYPCATFLGDSVKEAIQSFMEYYERKRFDFVGDWFKTHGEQIKVSEIDLINNIDIDRYMCDED